MESGNDGHEDYRLIQDDTCQVCAGQGLIEADDDYEMCPFCGGTGRL